MVGTMTGSAGYKPYKLPVALRVCVYFFVFARLSRSAKLQLVMLFMLFIYLFIFALTKSDIKKISIHSKHAASNYELKCGAACSVHVPKALTRVSDLLVVSLVHLQHLPNSDRFSPVNLGQMLLLQISPATCLHKTSRDFPRLRSC